MSILLSPLSVSKGQKFECELCGEVATIACAQCRVTFYCSKQHQQIDWSGIHDKICVMMAPLRNSPHHINSEEERKRRLLTLQMNQHALIDLSKNESMSYLVQGRYELAVPGALQALRFGIQVYGKGHIELVSSYLLLAEANMGLHKLRPAEEFLSLAQWSVFKSSQASHSLRSHLYRLFGKLYFSEGRLNEALEQLALDVYHSSMDVGPEHIDTANGYYHMALVFLKQDHVEQCLAFLDKVVDIWYKFVKNFIQQRQNVDCNASIETIADYLSEPKIGEARDILRSILDTRKEYLGAQHIASGEVSYVLGILCDLTHDSDKANRLYATALQIYEVQLGATHELTLDIRHAIDVIHSKLAAETPDDVMYKEHNTAKFNDDTQHQLKEETLKHNTAFR